MFDVDRVVDVILDAVAVPLAAFAARLRAIEARQAEKGAPGEVGAPGASGVAGNGIADAMIDQDGVLVLLMTDGTSRSCGRVAGRDGRSVDMVEVEALVAEKVAAIPRPKDGADGLGFDDMTEELADDGRTVVRRYQIGERTKEFRFPLAAVLDRGVYRDGNEYQAGDGVTWAGHYFIAQETTTDKPDGGKGWRLAVRRGRDGKNGKDGERGERGPDGKPGRDFNPAVPGAY